jgi:hypothetical protein
MVYLLITILVGVGVVIPVVSKANLKDSSTWEKTSPKFKVSVQKKCLYQNLILIQALKQTKIYFSSFNKALIAASNC